MLAACGEEGEQAVLTIQAALEDTGAAALAEAPTAVVVSPTATPPATAATPAAASRVGKRPRAPIRADPWGRIAADLARTSRRVRL